jgi:ketosteroid isomerase-like protein
MTTENEIRQANDDFYNAINAMFKGDLKPMQQIWSHSQDVTLDGPFGGTLLGYEDVIEEFRREADLQLAGKVEASDVLVRAGTDMAFVICNESSQNLTVARKSVPVNNRVTNVFRKEPAGWRLIHHHADVVVALLNATSEVPLIP